MLSKTLLRLNQSLYTEVVNLAYVFCSNGLRDPSSEHDSTQIGFTTRDVTDTSQKAATKADLNARLSRVHSYIAYIHSCSQLFVDVLLGI